MNFALLEKFSICFLSANHNLKLTFDLLIPQKIKIMRVNPSLFVRRTNLLLVLMRAEMPKERGYSGLEGVIQVHAAKIPLNGEIDKTFISARCIFLDRGNAGNVIC